MTYDPETLRPLILANNGNVRSIADFIDADSEDLRSFIMNTPVLRRALDEVIARGVDKSLTVLFEGLDDEHLGNKLASAKVFLKSRAAQRRGFNASADLELKMPRTGGALTLTWLPPEERDGGPPLIEGKVEDDG
jgi:hypothetical protein